MCIEDVAVRRLRHVQDVHRSYAAQRLQRRNRIMNPLFKKAWNDPVLSKVIAAIIVGALGLVGTWLWSMRDVVGSGTVVWVGVKAAVLTYIHWASSPAHISRAWLAIVGSLGVLGWAYAGIAWLREARQRLDALHRLREELARETENLAETTSRTRVMLASGATLPPPLPRATDLDDKQRLFLRLLYHQYPRSIDINRMAAGLSLPYPAIEQLCERMAAIGLVAVNPGPGPSQHLHDKDWSRLLPR